MAPLQENLYEEATNLRELGKTWGLNDAEVEQCFQLALTTNPRSQRPRTGGRFCRYFGAALLCFLAVVAVFHCVVSYHKPTRMAVMRYSQRVVYPVMRAVRLAALPFREVIDLSGLHEMTCIVPNPMAMFFMNYYNKFDCWPCEKVKDVPAFTNLTNFTRHYYHSGVPLVIKDSNLNPVTLADLKAGYLDNKSTLSQSSHRVKSNNPTILNIADVLTPQTTMEELMDTDLHVQWRVIRAGGVRLIRDLSPKPYFVPSKAEVATEMFVLIHTPSAEVHALSRPQFPNAWLTQGHGSQKVILTPVSTCKVNCTEVSIVLQPTDVLSYAPRFWELSASSFGDQLSIAFHGSFY